MSEYIVDGAEPNSTVLKSTTSNGYEHEKWLPVREEIVRCRDCRYYDPNDEPSNVYPDRYWCDLMAHYLHPDGFCAWGERRDA